MSKRIIWSNMHLDINDWKDFLKEEHPDVTSEYKQYELMMELNNQYFDDECTNLNKDIDGSILVIADIGLWHGRKQGYKILSENISDILYDDSADHIEWYGDGHNIKATAYHHDGTNYYEYRVIREDRNIDNLLDAIYNGEEISRQKINYYTKSLYPYVANIYGW